MKKKQVINRWYPPLKQAIYDVMNEPNVKTSWASEGHSLLSGLRRFVASIIADGYSDYNHRELTELVENGLLPLPKSERRLLLELVDYFAMDTVPNKVFDEYDFLDGIKKQIRAYWGG